MAAKRSGLPMGPVAKSNLAGSANPEDFEPVTFDAEVGLRGEFPDKLIDVAALELHHASAFGADQVVAVPGTNEHIAVMAVRLMNAVENPQAGQEVEGAEHGGSSDAGPGQA